MIQYNFRDIRKKNITPAVMIAAFALLLVSYFYVIQPVFFPLEEGQSIKMVSGTEYISGEYGQVIVRLSDRFGNPLENANCTAVILYPDKTYFLTDVPLQQSTIKGNYYAEFMTPSNTGIYEETITCFVLSGRGTAALVTSSSFHVSVALNYVKEMLDRESMHYLEVTRRLNGLSSDMGGLNSSMERLDGSVGGMRADLTATTAMMNATYSSMDLRISGVEAKIVSINESMNSLFGKFYGDMVNMSVSMERIFSP